MIETVTLSLWEDLIHSQRWEELRARLTATHSSDIAEAMGQIHAKEQAVVFRLLSRDHAAQVFSRRLTHCRVEKCAQMFA